MGKTTRRKTRKRRIDPKVEFRKSDEWRNFRKVVAEAFSNKDFITGKKLTKGFNVHHLHMDQDMEGYCDLSKVDEFMPLNRYTHKLLHYLFTYYKKDPSILERLKEVLDKMQSLSKAD
jgi:hypothetical protein